VRAWELSEAWWADSEPFITPRLFVMLVILNTLLAKSVDTCVILPWFAVMEATLLVKSVLKLVMEFVLSPISPRLVVKLA
jgi:hypothetical protein